MRKIIFGILCISLLIGCTNEITTFDQGVSEIHKANQKYNIDIKSMPASIGSAVLMRNDLKLIEQRSKNSPESFKLLLSYLKRSLEANILNLKAWEHGEIASTRDGFGCKSLPIIINSSILRNASAQIGYEAVDILQEFVEKYPQEAEAVNLSQRDVVFSNFFYAEVEKEASRDRKIIVHFCGHKYNLDTLEMLPEYK